MALLKRDELLKKEELEIVKVDLGNDEFVYARQMNGRQRDRFEQSLSREVRDPRGRVDYVRAMGDFRAKLAVNTMCDEEGNLILQPDDVGTLSENISAARLELFINVSMKLNAISEEDREGLVKNSEGGPSEDSILNSVSDSDTPTLTNSSED